MSTEAIDKMCDRDQQPEKVIDVIKLKEGMSAGEAGASYGYFPFKMSKRVGNTGTVYANDTYPTALQLIEQKCKSGNITNIKTVLAGAVEDPLCLPAQKSVGPASLQGQASNASPDSAYVRIAAGVLKTDSLIKTDPRPSFKNVESMIVVEDDVVKFEGYYNGADRNAPHEVQSQTKSVVAILLGIAIDKGYVSNEDEPLSKYFPEQFGPETGLKATVTIRDLLTMSAGFEWEEWIPVEAPGNDNTKMFKGGKWLEYALGRGMAQRPNTGFKYNSGCPMIVGAVIEKATRMRLEQFAAKFLFGPLEITGYRWLKDATGLCHAGGGLDLKPYDMVKIGILVMNNGRWKNTRIVSEAWINKATTPYFKTSLDDSRYGYYWWMRDMQLPTGKTTRVISAEGYGGQKLYILPEYRLIVAFTERNYSTPQVGPMVLRESVLPALR